MKSIPIILCFLTAIIGLNGQDAVPLIGLTWGDVPSKVMVPAELPRDFIEHADNLMIQYKKFGYVSMLVFADKGFTWTITAWVAEQCPAIILLDIYYPETEEGKYWIFDGFGKFKQVTVEESVEFYKNLTQELVRNYCKSSGEHAGT